MVPRLPLREIGATVFAAGILVGVIASATQPQPDLAPARAPDPLITAPSYTSRTPDACRDLGCVVRFEFEIGRPASSLLSGRP